MTSESEDGHDFNIGWEDGHKVGRENGLEEALAIVEEVIRKPVRRDGSPARELQIRDALRAALKDAKILSARS